MSLAEKLAYLKKRAGRTAGDIAAETHIPKSTLDKVLSGVTRSPSVETLCRLSRYFRVPVQYLIDDAIPIECHFGVIAESSGFHFLSARELDFTAKFCGLDEHDKMSLELILSLLEHRPRLCPGRGGEKHLICLEPYALGQRGVFTDRLKFRVITAPSSRLVDQADFAIHILDAGLEPVYSRGSVLAIKRQEAANEQIGVFLVNREGFIRKLQARRGLRILAALNKIQRDIPLDDTDEVETLGVVLGAIHTFHWQFIG